MVDHIPTLFLVSGTITIHDYPDRRRCEEVSRIVRATSRLEAEAKFEAALSKHDPYRSGG